MTLDKQTKIVENVIDDLKGENVVTLNVMKQCDDIEAIIIATGRSIQHVKSMATNVRRKLRELVWLS